MHWLIPSLPLAAAFALGAIVSPTDAVATAATTERLPVPSRITQHPERREPHQRRLGTRRVQVRRRRGRHRRVLASSEAAEQFVLAGRRRIPRGARGRVGRRRSAASGSRAFASTIRRSRPSLSLLTPFAAYLAAESLHASGILAVGGRGACTPARTMRGTSRPATRQHAWEVWKMLLYAFNGLVFLLLGLELPRRSLAASPASRGRNLCSMRSSCGSRSRSCGSPGSFRPRICRRCCSRQIREREGFRNPRGIFLVGWAGLRGSVTLAAALSIPLVRRDAGTPFPGPRPHHLPGRHDDRAHPRHQRLDATAGSSAVFGVRGDGNAEREERAARIAIAQAASNALRESLPKLKRAEEIAVAQRLIDEYDAPVASPLRQRRPPRGPRHAGRRRTQAAARRAARRTRGASRDARSRRHQRRDGARRSRRKSIMRNRSSLPPRCAVTADDAIRSGRAAGRHVRPRALRAPALRRRRATRARPPRGALVPAGDPPHRAGPARHGRGPARDAAPWRSPNFPASSSTSARLRATARATRC